MADFSIDEKLKKELNSAYEERAAAEKKKTEASDALSKAETNKKVADFALTRHKHNKAWLILLIIGLGFMIASVVIALYWQKSVDVHNFAEGFVYNGEPIFLLSIGGAVTVTALIFLFVKLSKRKQLIINAENADRAFDEVQAEYEKVCAAYERAEAQTADCEERVRKAEEAFLAANPEELAKRQAEEARKKEEALAALRREEEINRRAAEEEEKRRSDRLEADKMFEHPAAYVLDGKYESEYEVFEAAAEMGSPEAQERIVSYMMGMVYRNGVKPDPVKGEELALRYASEGNYAMYELLGRGFLYGEGDLKKDEKKGFAYLEKASSKGRQQAMIMAGICCYNGVGTEENVAAARGYFAKAAKQGNEQAIRVVAAIDNGERLRF